VLFGASATVLGLCAAGGLLVTVLVVFVVYRVQAEAAKRRRYKSMAGEAGADEQRTAGFKNKRMAAPDSFLSEDPSSIAMGQQTSSPLSESFVKGKGNQEDWL
jgi:hypothetical protein